MNEIFRKIFYSALAKIFKNRNVDVPIILKKNNPKILIFRYDKIGDMLVSFPSFELLRYYFPNAEIWILASPLNSFLLNNFKAIDKSIILPKGLIKKLQTIFLLRKERFDVIINYVFYRTTKAALIANLINPLAYKFNIGHNTRDSIYGKLFTALFPIASRGKLYMSEFLCKYVCWIFGLTNDHKFLNMYNLFIPESSFVLAKEFLFKNNLSKTILVNISARKRWSLENYKMFIRLVREKFSELDLIFVSHPSDNKLLSRITEGEEVFTFYQSKDFYDVIALISMVDIVFSPDTSIVHFANAFGKPILMMYSEKDTHLNEWIPNVSKFVGFCSNNEKDYNDIEPEKVVESIGKFLN
ncbi:MAG: glycosyltransferase family 9 protein [Ignavibacteria bacterium]|nr:glycosyltransferase family 9 protein [Ignavibacteria bacterium]